ncbi:hypothetical protein [Microvirga lenta]|uniref:hypothetical protein n=1 Tax=Microvirga lenta TaxID=2881337 RepID=UPI001CFF9F37|nr:hypothetical protein [Microvirga lenta]MCB5177770.1 hypothetical protein [Microvirga lenta]
MPDKSQWLGPRCFGGRSQKGRDISVFSQEEGSKSVADAVALTVLVFSAIALFTVRLPIGADLSDEAYYLTHIVEWLRNGFVGSNNLNIQQLSALFVYPFARAGISGDLSGAILFLRVVYAAMVMAACVPLYFFLRRLRSAPVAVLGTGLLIAFIPFGLPAPSYNTIALCGMTAALSLFGIAFVDAGKVEGMHPNPSAKDIALLAASAAFWGIAVVSYPTLAPAPVLQAVLALMLARSRPERRFVAIYVLCGLAAALALAAILISVFGLGRLIAMVDYTSASAQLSAGLAGKLRTTLTRLAAQPLATCAFVGIILLPLLSDCYKRSRLVPDGLIYLTMFTIVAFSDAVAFIKSHDIIVLAALFGAVAAFRSAPNPAGSAVRIVWATSIGSALITAATSAGSIFNVPIGGFMAACLGLALTVPRAGDPSIWPRAMGYTPVILTLAVVAYISQTFIYGEAPPQRPVNARVIEFGPLRGVRTTPEFYRFITDVTAAFSAHGQAGRTVTVFGPISGLYLLTEMTPHTLSTWSLRSSSGEAARRMAQAFFAQHPPDFVAVYRDPWTEPLGSMETELLKRYHSVSTIKVGWREFELFARRSGPPKARS